MQLANFGIATDSIGVEYADDYFDLHNCFDFKGLSYRVDARTITLFWSKNANNWVPQDSPRHLELNFEGVYLFKARQRDPDVPFTEDDCLNTIGFTSNEKIDEIDAYVSHEPKTNSMYLTMDFMSGFALKIGAATVTLVVQRIEGE